MIQHDAVRYKIFTAHPIAGITNSKLNLKYFVRNSKDNEKETKSEKMI